MEKTTDFDALMVEVLADADARAAYAENTLRRHLAERFEGARRSKGLSLRGLATEMGTSLSQVQRLLHHEVGGSLTLKTICRAADVLGLEITVEARARTDKGSPRAATWQKMSMSRLAPEQHVSIGSIVRYDRASAGDWHESVEVEGDPAEVKGERVSA